MILEADQTAKPARKFATSTKKSAEPSDSKKISSTEDEDVDYEDWIHVLSSAWQKQNNYADMARAANELVENNVFEPIGVGSSRAVFIIKNGEHAGNIIKVATNAAGLEQNSEELFISTDATIGFVAHVIDSYSMGGETEDTKKGDAWIVSEPVRTIDEDQFSKLTGGVSIKDLHDYVRKKLDPALRKKNEEFYDRIDELQEKYSRLTGDLGKIDSWGVARKSGKLALRDYGLSGKGFKKHYDKMGRYKVSEST